jgi:arsenite methyltransferase
MAPRFIARQLAHPEGMLGHVIGHLMNLRNARMNTFAIAQLAPMPADRVLKIGFGGGVAVRPLLASA